MKTNKTINEETTATLHLTEDEATCAIDALHNLNLTMWNKMPTTWQQSPGREMIEKLNLRITNLWTQEKWSEKRLKPITLNRLETLMLRDATATLSIPITPSIFPGSILEQIDEAIVSVSRKIYASLEETWPHTKR